MQPILFADFFSISERIYDIQGRITNLSDLSSLLKFLFDCPKLSSTESQTCFLELKLKPERYGTSLNLQHSLLWSGRLFILLISQLR